MTKLIDYTSAPVAQLDRVPGFNPSDQEFEALSGRTPLNQTLNEIPPKMLYFSWYFSQTQLSRRPELPSGRDKLVKKFYILRLLLSQNINNLTEINNNESEINSTI